MLFGYPEIKQINGMAKIERQVLTVGMEVTDKPWENNTCGNRLEDASVGKTKPNTQIIFLMASFNKRKQCSLEKLVILRQNQEIHKMSLKHLISPGSKEMT